jgi:hypothetical protein
VTRPNTPIVAIAILFCTYVGLLSYKSQNNYNPEDDIYCLNICWWKLLKFYFFWDRDPATAAAIPLAKRAAAPAAKPTPIIPSETANATLTYEHFTNTKGKLVSCRRLQ